LPFSALHHIGVLVWSPLASGFLTDDFTLENLDPQDFRRRHPYAQEEAWSKLRAIRQKLQALACDHQQTLVNLALAWVLRNPAVTGAIVGIRNEQEARSMLEGALWKFPAQKIQVIERILADWPLL
jgi:aryl-alcohol dehydrogenase-like predicted oxidoreductase